MENNGGTQHGAPQRLFSCNICGSILESAASLDVHNMNHHPEISRWGTPTTTTSSNTTTATALDQSATDSENNNQPLKHHIKLSNSPIAAAADSSDQPGTPQPQYMQYAQPLIASEMQTYQAYYEPHYYPHSMDYGIPLHQQQQHHHLEYKTVPSRYNPYNNLSGVKPKVVSSSGEQIFGGEAGSPVPPGQPTPSPSPKICDKCGQVCETDTQLMEHARIHQERDAENIETAGFFPQHPYVQPKDETGASDILDLDSQEKVVTYQPHPMMSLQSMQRQHMVWDAHFQSAPPSQPVLYKPDYPLTPPIKSEHGSKIFVEGDTPQDCPSTTTPGTQETSVFRTFEPPTSSLPVKTAGAQWKSNEARRPKTYNCTACNKWFTSSGHLKRHYNTTLHKNAVKSSGAPDPALTPISHHHHPQRDPNYTGKTRRNNNVVQQPIQQPVPPPEPPIRSSPDYQAQFPFANQGFQQYNHQPINGVHPNGVAGPSVHASQPRGLHQYSSMAQQITTPTEPEIVTHQMDQMGNQQITTITRSPTTMQESSEQMDTTELYNHHHNPSVINTNIPSFQITQSEEQNYHPIIGENTSNVEMYGPYFYQTENKIVYTGDTVPPFSPDTPNASTSNEVSYIIENTFTDAEGNIAAPLIASIAPTALNTSPSLYSPPIPSNTVQHENVSTTKILTPEELKKKHDFRCDLCEKTFNKVCYLTQHNKTFHTGDKPHKCGRCGKRFGTEDLYEAHVAKHEGSKPHKCEMCPKEFNHKTDLRRHMCVHTNDKPFGCQECGKTFIRKDHMIKHTETHNKKDKKQKNSKAAAKHRQLQKIKAPENDSELSNSSISKLESI